MVFKWVLTVVAVLLIGTALVMWLAATWGTNHRGQVFALVGILFAIPAIWRWDTDR